MPPEKTHWLSKTRIQYGRQCHKRLWLEVYRRETVAWSDAALARMAEGTRFGELAQDLLGGGHLIDADHREPELALVQTRQALAQPREHLPRLFEPAFEHDGVRVRVDALERDADGDRLIEIKSTTRVKAEHLWDCAIQTWVARGDGCDIRQIMLGHVDRDFVYSEPGQYQGLLALADISDEVEARVPQIPAIVDELRQVVAGPCPEIRTGEHCGKPYHCPFLDHCLAQEPARPSYPVDILPQAPRLIERLKARGYADLATVPDGELSSATHRRIAQASRSGEAWVSPELSTTLRQLAFPRFYLDIETVGLVIPRWPGTRPFQALPFQFSCHVERVDGALEHGEFIDLSGDAPMADFVLALLAGIGKAGPVLVWNRSFEAGQMRQLAARFPEHAPALANVADRMVDLLPLFRQHYYHPAQLGSWSIKAVLPTIAPELDYGTLPVADGLAAQAAYLQATDPATTPEQRHALADQLRRYCALDTLAMLRLVQHFSR